MDSGNTSGSLQSSSGGDDEFDSRSDHRILSNNIPSSAATSSAHFSSENQNILSLHNLPASTSTVLFDPSSSFLQSLSSHSNSNPLLNMDFLRPSVFGGNQFPLMPNNNPLMQPRSSPPVNNNNNNNQSSTSLGVRNSKKRTRASRRAPTTVLTTDTSNFRAMVQEFTGIPAPPFSGGSSYSRRLDLFGSSTLRSGHLDPMYPLRPSPQKPAANPFLLDMHNPLLSFQSLLQPHPHPHQPSQGLSTQGQHQQQGQGQGQGWRSGVGSTQDHLRASNSSSNDHQPPYRSSNNDATIFSYASHFDHHHNTNPPPPPTGDATLDSWICPSD